jgi:hypothetical protein
VAEEGPDAEGGNGEAARAALRRLLLAYDHANRLAIDAVYAQFSPTLDDFYAEALRLELGAEARGEVPVEIVLTRTVPGQAPASVRGSGAPFPLAAAAGLVRRALAAAPAGEAGALAERLRRGEAQLRPRQVGGSQVVTLVVEPDGADLPALLARLFEA